MPYQMPAHSVASDFRDLFLSLLNFILTQIGNSGRDSFADHPGGMGLTDCDQSDIFRAATGAKCSGGDARAHLPQTFTYWAGDCFSPSHSCKKIECQL